MLCTDNLVWFFFCLLVFLFADFHFLFIPWVLKTNNYQTTLYCSFPFPLHLMYFASESLKHLIWKKMIMVSVFRLPWKGWGDTEHTTFLCIQVLYFHNQEHVEVSVFSRFLWVYYQVLSTIAHTKCWITQSAERGTLNFIVMDSSPTLGAMYIQTFLCKTTSPQIMTETYY